MSETSLDERLHQYMFEKLELEMADVEYQLMKLREDCETIYVQTGCERAKFLAVKLAWLESKKNPDSEYINNPN
jgi:hypothetical protein